jgi:hypothetical protein
MLVAIDDAIPAAPGNWLELPAEHVPEWLALTLAERNQVLAGRGQSTLVNIVRQLAVSAADDHGF